MLNRSNIIQHLSMNVRIREYIRKYNEKFDEESALPLVAHGCRRDSQ